MAERRVHPDCPNSGNPYHECVEDCYMKIANGKPRKSSKSKPSGPRSGGYDTSQSFPKERKRANGSCPKTANPYHECGDHCFQNGTSADPHANRKQTRSVAAEAPASRRQNRESNSQTRPAPTEKLNGNAKAPTISATNAPSAPSQMRSKEIEPEREVEFSKPLSPVVMYSGEIKPDDFSFNKGEQVRSSNSIPISGTATPVLGLSPDRRAMKEQLKDSFASVASSNLSQEDTGNHYFSNELVPEKFAGNNHEQVAREAVRGSMSSSFSGNSHSFRESDDDDDEYNDDVRSVVSEARVPVGKYQVKSSVSSILQAILEKYGDIAENCQLESVAMRSYYLECVCFVVQELQFVSFMNLTKSKVKEMIAIVKDLESSRIEIGWLKAILEEMSEVTEFTSQHQTVKAAKVKSDQGIESARQQLELNSQELAQKEQEVSELKTKVAEAEDRLHELEAEASKLDQAVSSINSQIDNLHFKSLLQELL